MESIHELLLFDGLWSELVSVYPKNLGEKCRPASSMVPKCPKCVPNLSKYEVPSPARLSFWVFHVNGEGIVGFNGLV